MELYSTYGGFDTGLRLSPYGFSWSFLADMSYRAFDYKTSTADFMSDQFIQQINEVRDVFSMESTYFGRDLMDERDWQTIRDNYMFVLPHWSGAALIYEDNTGFTAPIPLVDDQERLFIVQPYHHDSMWVISQRATPKEQALAFDFLLFTQTPPHAMVHSSAGGDHGTFHPMNRPVNRTMIKVPSLIIVNDYVDYWYDTGFMKLLPWCQIQEVLLEEIGRTMTMPVVFRYNTPIHRSYFDGCSVVSIHAGPHICI